MDARLSCATAERMLPVTKPVLPDHEVLEWSRRGRQGTIWAVRHKRNKGFRAAKVLNGSPADQQVECVILEEIRNLMEERPEAPVVLVRVEYVGSTQCTGSVYSLMALVDDARSNQAPLLHVPGD
jgi:hypothetical protein